MAKRKSAGTKSPGRNGVTDIQAIIDNFKIGEPLQSLFHPVFTHKYEERYSGYPHGGVAATLKLEIQAPDAYEQRGTIPIITERRFYREDMDERRILELMRQMLHSILIHEADESIHYAGERIFDPHKHEKH